MMLGMKCLEALALADGPMGSREMARQFGIEHTKIHRALGTLAHLGLAQATDKGKYRPGPAIHVLAAQSLRGSRLLASAMPHLRALRANGTTVALGVLWEEYICYLVHCRPGRPLEDSIGRHELWPLNESSLGVLLYALRDESAEAEHPPMRLVRPASSPVVDMERYAEAVREHRMARLTYKQCDVVSVAVPIGKPIVAAIGASRENPDGNELKDLVTRLRDAAESISTEIAS